MATKEKNVSVLSRISLLFAASLLSSCGGGGASAPQEPSSAADGALLTAQSGELVAYFKARIVQRSAQGMDGTAWPAPTPAVGGAAADGLSTAGLSGTNLQEAGVDEDDLLKSDGSFIHALHLSRYDSTSGAMTPARLTSSRIQPDGSLADAGSVALDAGASPGGMYLADSGRRIAVVGQNWNPGPAQADLLLPLASSQVSLDVFDVASGGNPAPTHKVVIDGRLVATRVIGNVLYLASTWTPNLSRYRVPAGTPAAETAAALAGLKTSELLPTLRTDGGPAQPLVAESDCFLQTANASLSLQLTTVTAIDLSTPNLERRSRCFVGDAGTLYMSATHLYLASSRNYWIASMSAATLLPQQATTDIHKFALEGMQVAYRGSGEVTGHLGWDAEKAPYRMSEHNGDLRVLTFTGETGWFGPVTVTAPAAAVMQQGRPSPATLTILRENPAARRLDTVGMLPNADRPAPLGREGEQVYAVQFVGPRAYVVTFRRTDPLYVLDLSNPADPKTVGELTVPGFSEYLFPLADGKLLGVGKEATADGFVQGLKLSLFDVSNPAASRELVSVKLGERGSASALDYSRHGINILQQGTQARIALPVRLSSTGPADAPRTEHGLARFTVDTAAGTLTQRPMFASRVVDGSITDWTSYDVSRERSMQTPAATYFLSGGRVLYTPE